MADWFSETANQFGIEDEHLDLDDFEPHSEALEGSSGVLVSSQEPTEVSKGPVPTNQNRRVTWTNAQVRSLLRSIQSIWDGHFQEMLENLSKEEKRQQTRKLRQGWALVQKRFHEENSDTNLSAKQLAEKFRKLALPSPGCTQRNSIDELMVLHTGASTDVSEILPRVDIEHLDDENPVDDLDFAEKYPKKKLPGGKAKPKKKTKISQSDEYLDDSYLDPDMSFSYDEHFLRTEKRKKELEIEILQIDREIKKRKIEVYEILRRKIENDECNISAILKANDNVV
eukprot:TRINITY_DN1352_c0_g1_i22.p1 TRINITY_DN1352_c0_g1~~TRINITY_DN1352_c0_g1_i22.p1  ORF type:complete len:284 (-),score=41.41 TRINITY_DN1352_c0_g1_i22:225-1076(-)